jgi:hypothetical protein
MTPGTRGLYEGTDKDGKFWQIPRNVDPAQDGTRLAAHHPRIFDTSGSPDSVPKEEFDARVEAAVPSDVLARIDHVVAAGKWLAERGLADSPPLSEKEWRRGMILSWSHSRDLVVAHDAIGHPRNLSGRHDVDEVVLAKRLKTRVDGADQWYRDYAFSLDEGAWVNVGFFNPHISASLYRWGDAMKGPQNGMDAHRLSAHHQGTPEAPLDWVERAVNFVVHHIPREHLGIRHEPRGSYSELEDRLSTDPAIKDAPIGKVIARDAASLYEMLEREGKVVPWHLLNVPANFTPTVSMIEHSALVVRAAEKFIGMSDAERAEYELDESANPRCVARARVVLASLPAEIERVRAAGLDHLVGAYSKMQQGD